MCILIYAFVDISKIQVSWLSIVDDIEVFSAYYGIYRCVSSINYNRVMLMTFLYLSYVSCQ